MSISKVRNSDKNNDRSIQHLYDKLNELVDAINQNSTTESSGTNKEKIRLVEQADGTRVLEARFKDGWNYVNLTQKD